MEVFLWQIMQSYNAPSTGAQVKYLSGCSLSKKLYTPCLVLTGFWKGLKFVYKLKKLIKQIRCMVADLCYSCFLPATLPNKQSKNNKLKWRACNKNMLISEGVAQRLINKTSPRGGAEGDLRNKTTGLQDENTVISGVARHSLINKTSPCATAY
jgi:hypothetical protein